MSRFRVFDPEGKVKDWLEIGRTVHVWRNHDLSSPDVGALAFTATTEGQPIKAPHWRFGETPEASTTDAAAFLFYERVGVASGIVRGLHVGQPHRVITTRVLFSDSYAGLRAANRAADKLTEATNADGHLAPIGRVFVAFSVQRLTYSSDEKRDDGRALASLSHFAVIEWCAIVSAAEEMNAASDLRTAS